jgi:integrase
MMMRSGVLDDAQMLAIAEEYINHGITKKKSAGAAGLNAPSNLPLQKSSKDSLLSVIVEKYIQEYKDTENAADTTSYELETKCRQFVRVVGDMDINAVSRETILEFVKVLRQLPRNMNKLPQYKGKSIAEMIEMKPVDTLSDTTVNNYLGRVNSFFVWARRVGHVARNPAEGIKLNKKKLTRPDEERKAYSQEDLKKLIDSFERYRDEELKPGSRPERLWIPLISLYSGMRENEICQLHVEDVQKDKESGIWYFNIELAEDGSRAIKTAAGRRMIPVHKDLVEIGFLKYHASVLAQNQPRLWMNLTKSVRGYHRNFVYWFLGHNNAKGFLRKYITEDEKLNFHSFRHTFINGLKQKLVEETIIAEIAGHATDSETFGRYGKPYMLKIKQDTIDQQRYDFDIDRLRLLTEMTF